MKSLGAAGSRGGGPRPAALVVCLAALVLLGACETIRIKAMGSEKDIDWGVSVLF